MHGGCISRRRVGWGPHLASFHNRPSAVDIEARLVALHDALRHRKLASLDLGTRTSGRSPHYVCLLQVSGVWPGVWFRVSGTGMGLSDLGTCRASESGFKIVILHDASSEPSGLASFPYDQSLRGEAPLDIRCEAIRNTIRQSCPECGHGFLVTVLQPF